jgi:AcrR family transcriptional regulator
MEAAMEEMNEQGTRFTMGMLAARLAISKRTLYEHFESKEVLIEAIVDAIILDLEMQRIAIVKDTGLDLADKLKRMLSVRPRIFTPADDRVKLDLRRQFPGLWAKARKSAEDQWILINNVLREGIAEGCFREIYVPVVQKMLRGAVDAIADEEFLMENKLSFHEMIGHVTDILIYGIIVPEKRD